LKTADVNVTKASVETTAETRGCQFTIQVATSSTWRRFSAPEASERSDFRAANDGVRGSGQLPVVSGHDKSEAIGNN